MGCIELCFYDTSNKLYLKHAQLQSNFTLYLSYYKANYQVGRINLRVHFKHMSSMPDDAKHTCFEVDC